jgi:CheY-like chemotaxis protein
MDDDEIILSTIMEIFDYLGYEGETARDGKEAIEKYKKRLQEKKPYDVVIMDLTIPGGMGGREAIKLLRAIDPRVRALVSSGYSNDPVMAEYEHYGFNGLIAKPYKIEDLADAIDKAFVHK